MLYGKILNGDFTFAPNPLIHDGMQCFNPFDETLFAAGYKPVVLVPPPEPREGYMLIFGWEETDTEITRVWMYEQEEV